VLVNAHLRKADFDGAQQQHANLSGADLREATFTRAQLQATYLANAQLQAASLSSAQLQGAVLASAQLQGAVLASAQLQGAWLIGTQLQGAFLKNTQLQGASLYRAQLQGAYLDGAQLQGAGLSNTGLDNASLRDVIVWRAAPPANDKLVAGALIAEPELGPKYYCSQPTPGRKSCDWAEASYAALKSLIEHQVPEGRLREEALKRIEPLGKPPYQEDPKSADAWRSLEHASRPSAETYPKRLVETLIKLGCAADGGPYVVGGLLFRLGYPFTEYTASAAAVAAAFLDEAKCPGARGLSEHDKARLREIRDRAGPSGASY
jgi:uncharacterized protein YjbI with pentapeptide repeats